MVVARRIEGQGPEQVTAGGEHPDLGIGHQHDDPKALERRPHADMAEPALVADGELARPVDAVMADAAMGL